MRSFGKYVPQEVVRSLLDGGSEACLGVERRNMTLMFTDIARFTSISEQLSPNELVTLMSEYFSAMTAVLHAHEGTLLEFIGDAILACWNAPVAVDGHAVPRWHMLAAALGVLLVGPSALGYALCALVIYLVYTRVVAAGETPQTLGDAYLNDVAAAAGKQGGKALGRW